MTSNINEAIIAIKALREFLTSNHGMIAITRLKKYLDVHESGVLESTDREQAFMAGKQSVFTALENLKHISDADIQQASQSITLPAQQKSIADMVNNR